MQNPEKSSSYLLSDGYLSKILKIGLYRRSKISDNRLNQFYYPRPSKIAIKSQSRILQYHLETKVEPDFQPHSRCVLKWLWPKKWV